MVIVARPRRCLTVAGVDFVVIVLVLVDSEDSALVEVHVVIDSILGELTCSVALVLIELLALAAVGASVEEDVVSCDLIVLITTRLHPALCEDPFKLFLLTFSPNSVSLEVVVVVLDCSPGVVEGPPLPGVCFLSSGVGICGGCSSRQGIHLGIRSVCGSCASIVACSGGVVSGSICGSKSSGCDSGRFSD